MTEPRHLKVEHETSYDYSARVDLAYHIAYLQPAQTSYQRLDAFALVVEPTPSHRSVGRDTYGNHREVFSLYGSHERLRVHAESSVRVAPRFETLDPGSSPPWHDVREELEYRAGSAFQPESEFTFASPFVPLLGQLHDYAAESFPVGQPLLAGALELMQRIHADLTYDAASTDVSTPLAAAFEQRRGVCQDYAHVAIGALRALGLPAAYVSGYLLSNPPQGEARLLGADASHAWVRVWCPVNGWVEFDPTNDCLVDSGHVTLAIGRDYGDVTPVRGVIRGGGRHALAVRVSVVPVE
ncbi:MAG TPA: transglutaminase family protein [Burkholderiaceae bacterium]|nr:transglutaminase family protein [Burkholderiaceae bacterium]